MDEKQQEEFINIVQNATKSIDKIKFLNKVVENGTNPKIAGKISRGGSENEANMPNKAIANTCNKSPF